MENRVESMSGAAYFPADSRAAVRFDDLAEELGGIDALRPQQAMLIADIVRGEMLKAKLWEDIEKRGVGSEVRNGSQRQWRENKSIATQMKLADQQRRIMMALGLIAREKDQPKEDAADEDDFDAL